MTHPLLPNAQEAVLSATWGADAHSASSPEGLVRLAPLEIAPLPQQMPSGIVRSQSLHMLQRFLNVPATPSYVGSAGGVVLDRVCTAFGGANWWGTVTGRLRAQSVWNKPSTREGKPHRALRDPSAYALSARLRASVPTGGTTLRAWAELDSLEGYLPQGAASSPSEGAAAAAAGGAEGPGSAGAPAKHPVRVRLSAHAGKLLPGHDVTAEAAVSGRAGTIRGPGALSASPVYTTQGKHATLAITSKPGLARGAVAYRAGLFAQAKGGGAADAGSAAAAAHPGAEKPLGEEVAVRAQGAVAFGGQAKLFPREKLKPGATAKLPYSLLKHTARLTLGGVAGLTGALPLGDRAAAAPGSASASASGAAGPSGAAEPEPSGARAFASAGAVLQFGRFTRPLLDYSSLALRLDAAYGTGPLSGPRHTAGTGSGAAAAAPPPAGRGRVPLPWPWGPSGEVHLTASASQQLYGPVRARADCRVLLEPHRRPAVVETVYGVDVALPQLLGAARVVCWYSPTRQEAMAELRLLEG